MSRKWPKSYLYINSVCVHVCGFFEIRWKVLEIIEIEPNYDFNKTMNELLESSREKVNVFKKSDGKGRTATSGENEKRTSNIASVYIRIRLSLKKFTQRFQFPLQSL